ncbi:MAG: hypothetical protein HQM11_04885 [SAR324 cluster bacterium]|nr:hypothetical protein [SAR324 cluster bacterium]
MYEPLQRMFERFCHNSGLVPANDHEMEQAIQAFAETATHDLTRAFYLKELRLHPVEITPIGIDVQRILKKLPKIEDASLQTLCNQEFGLGDDLVDNLKSDHQLYSISQNDAIKAYQEDPSKTNMIALVENFNLEECLSLKKQIEEQALRFDEIYHDALNKFLEYFKQIQEEIKKTDQQGGLPSRRESILPTIYIMTRRGEVGIELIHLTLQGYFSYLCYLDIIQKRGNDFDHALRNGIKTSQLDLMHDYGMLKTELYISLRKQGVAAIIPELEKRKQLFQLMDEFYTNKWIDAKQVEVFILNSINQPCEGLLNTLKIHKIKKEIQVFTRKKIKGRADETELMNKVVTLLKNVPDVFALETDLLKNGTSIEEVLEKLKIEQFLNILVRHVKRTAQAQPQPSPEADEHSAKKAFEKIVAMKHEAHEPQAPQKTDVTPTPVGPAKPETSIPQKPTEPKVAESGVLLRIRELTQELAQMKIQFQELSGSASGQTAIDQLGTDKIVFESTGNNLLEKLKILEQKIKANMPEGMAEKFLQKYEREIQFYSQADTQAFLLMEKLKTYGETFVLTPEEITEIENSDANPQERLFYIEKCDQKYSLIHTLRQMESNKRRFDEMKLGQASALAIFVFQDILRSNPWFFEKFKWTNSQALMSSVSAQVNIARAIAKVVYDLTGDSKLILQLFQWGLFLLAEDRQQQVLEAIKQGIKQIKSLIKLWEMFKSNPVGKDSIRQLLTSCTTVVNKHMDAIGQKYKARIEEGFNRGTPETKPAETTAFASSLLTALYFQGIHTIYKTFNDIQSWQGEGFPSSGIEPPSELMESLEQILEMDFYEERLEMLVEIVSSQFSPSNPMIHEGKIIYKEILNFDF